MLSSSPHMNDSTPVTKFYSRSFGVLNDFYINNVAAEGMIQSLCTVPSVGLVVGYLVFEQQNLVRIRTFRRLAGSMILPKCYHELIIKLQKETIWT